MTIELRKLERLEAEVSELKASLANRPPASIRLLLEVRRAQMLSTIEATSIELRIARQEAAHLLLEGARKRRLTAASIALGAGLLVAFALLTLLAHDFLIGVAMVAVGSVLMGLPVAVKNVAQERLNREALRPQRDAPSLGTVVL